MQHGLKDIGFDDVVERATTSEEDDTEHIDSNSARTHTRAQKK